MRKYLIRLDMSDTTPVESEKASPAPQDIVATLSVVI